MYCDFDNEILEFNSIKEAAEKVGITRERARQILHSNSPNKYHMRYEKNDILKEKICLSINNKHFKFDKISDVGLHTGIPICEIRDFLEGSNKNNFYNIRFLGDDITEADILYPNSSELLILDGNIFSSCGLDITPLTLIN